MIPSSLERQLSASDPDEAAFAIERCGLLLFHQLPAATRHQFLTTPPGAAALVAVIAGWGLVAAGAPGVWVAGNVADVTAGVMKSAAGGASAAAANNDDLSAEDTTRAMATAPAPR